MKTPPGEQKTPTKRWAFLLALIGLEASIALAWLFALPGEGGISLRRLLLAAPLGLAALVGLGLAGMLAARAPVRARVEAGLNILRGSQFIVPLVLTLMLGMFYFLAFGRALLALTDEVYARLAPDAAFLALACLSWLVFLSMGPRSSEPDARPARRTLLYALAWLLPGVLAALWVWVDAATTASAYAGAGAPVLPYQFLGVVFALIVAMALADSVPMSARAARVTAGLGAALLWIGTISLWLSSPVPANYFMLPANTADGAIYPLSDARLYDVNAQDMLSGNGLAGGGTLPRPLFSFLLAGLHALFGQDYTAVVNAHAALIALLPVGLFLLGRRLGHPWAGLAAGILLAVREYNQTILAPTYTMGSPRMLLSEGLTALLLVGFALLALRWLRDPLNRRAALLSGTLLGLLALLRTQTILLGPLLAGVVLVAVWSQRSRLWKPILFFVLGAGLVVLPWMGRNLVRNGQFVLEDAAYLNQVLTTTREEAAASRADGLDGSSGRFLFIDRGSQVISYSLNSTMSSLYQLPLRWDPGSDLWAYVANGQPVTAGQDIDFYPYLRMDAGQILFVIAHLVLIAAGLASAWSALGWAGIFPMLIYLVYNLSAAIFGYSGWRFIQPVDWVVLLYWAAGLVWLIERILSRGLRLPARAVPADGPRARPRGLTVALTVGVLAGLLLPVGEALVPRSAPAVPQIVPAGARGQALEALMAEPGTIVLTGRLYYPVYVDNARAILLWKLSEAADLLPLLYFDVRETASTRVVLRVSDPAGGLVHGSVVQVVGCPRGNLIDAAAVMVNDPQPLILYSRDGVPASCGK